MTSPEDLQKLEPKPLEGEGSSGRAIVVVPHVRDGRNGGDASLRSPEARLEEAVGLALAIDLDVAGSFLVTLSQIRPATYIGTGKVEELAGIVRAEDAGLVVVDAALSPVQQRNLEKELGTKVLDRTGLILEIFGKRARTREGTLQVELAHLNWQKSRLVRSWTHLERQRGGFGFLGGPGETQIESDRRVIGERIHKIEKELDQVRRTRGLHRSSRKRVPYPVIAMVGYTNAGKSTLFNRLTKADVMAEDMLFATLDPTLRVIVLPHGTRVILSDTVGFISDLPTTLIAAFRATLEEVLEADIILHVRDIAHEDTDAQSGDVRAILNELGVDPYSGKLIEVWNKIDALDDEAAARMREIARREKQHPVVLSALSGEGVEGLLNEIEHRLAKGRVTLEITLGAADGENLHWLYEHAEVLERQVADDGSISLVVRIPAERASGVRRRFGLPSVENE